MAARCRLRKCCVVIFVFFCISVWLIFWSLDEIDFYLDYDGIPGLQNDNSNPFEVDYGGDFVNGKAGIDRHEKDGVNVTAMGVKVPIIIWWTPLTGDRGKVKSCADKNQCFFTIDRHFRDHPKTKAFLFYGTDFKPGDLPLPRQQTHEWALFHEESPKNNYILSHKDCLVLFNHTATFKRESDFPITSQYLENLSNLMSTKYLVPTRQKSTQGLAPVVYIHSDCNPPSDRDSYVKELMKYIKVDSYGACLHNRDLPSNLVDPMTMANENLYKILAKYKFTLAFENAVCDDYITEKLWRPLMLGSIPVYRGSTTVRDWLPDGHSAIIADDFRGPKELANFLNYLDRNDLEYESYLKYKTVGITNKKLIQTMEEREWGVNDYERFNFITGFECFVCRRIHQNLKRKNIGLPQKTHRSQSKHLGCPRPQYFEESNHENQIELYLQMYDEGRLEAKALRKIVEAGQGFDAGEYNKLMLLYKKKVTIVN